MSQLQLCLNYCSMRGVLQPPSSHICLRHRGILSPGAAASPLLVHVSPHLCQAIITAQTRDKSADKDSSHGSLCAASLLCNQVSLLLSQGA